jgi:leucyl aminopeptidase
MVSFTVAPKLEKRPIADLLVWPYYAEKKQAKAALELGSAFQTLAGAPLSLRDFAGKEGELLFLYLTGQPEKRLLLLGLGAKEKVTTETLRRAYSALAKACHQRKIRSINLLVPEMAALSREAVWRGMVEGLLLTNYTFDKLKVDTVREQPAVLLQKIGLVGAPKQALELAKKLALICEGVYLVRDLANSNADEVTPRHLMQVTEKMAKSLPRTKVTLLDKARLTKEKMGLLLAVGQGSIHEPALICLEYNPFSKTNAKGKDHTIIVGKGITYDTGGLNLKSSGMETMKGDMAGGAVALAVVLIAAQLKLPVHLTAVVAAAENSVSARSYKPGDVYISYSGKTVEISNTDAEGRLVLADALSYAIKKLKPTRLIDVATLTGGVDVALGSEATGLLANNDALADSLIRAGSETFERLWRLPLHEEYKELLKSDVADMKNAAGRSASPITAAMFLKAFVDQAPHPIPWAHLDIASTAFLNEAKRYQPKFATGVGVRLLIEFLESLATYDGN